MNESRTTTSPFISQPALRLFNPAIYQRLFALVNVLALTYLFVAVIYGIVLIVSQHGFIAGTILLSSVILSLQSSFTIYTLLYSWKGLDDKPKLTLKHRHTDRLSFTALIPARHEEAVIEDTMKAVEAIDYPSHLKQSIIICSEDDVSTIQKIRVLLESLPTTTTKLVIFNEGPINKPHALNVGLKQAHNEVVVIFDAEDRPHPNIYKLANQVMQADSLDVLQAGVQLMNYDTTWFSGLNVLEYYFWFSSVLHYFASKQVLPLGGNTVFFKRELLQRYKGWDEQSLTEDADIGIRLSVAGANVGVAYDHRYVTQEETPASVTEFIKQRTRWNQGFFQILLKATWWKFPSFTQRFLALYILSLPLMLTLLYIYVPLMLATVFLVKLPVSIALLSFVPLFLLFFQWMVNVYGMMMFIHQYGFKLTIKPFLAVMLGFFPFQLLLSIGAIRALFRHATQQNGWEKTSHLNLHHSLVSSVYAD